MDAKKVATIVGLIIGLCTIIGTVYKLDIRWHQATALAKVEQQVAGVNARLEIKICNDKLNNIQERMWKLKDRYGEDLDEFPQDAKDEYRRLEKEKEELEKKIKEIRAKIKESE